MNTLAPPQEKQVELEALRLLRLLMHVPCGSGRTLADPQPEQVITLASLSGYLLPGVDMISVGALTHSAPAADISMYLLADFVD